MIKSVGFGRASSGADHSLVLHGVKPLASLGCHSGGVTVYQSYAGLVELFDLHI